MSFFRDLMFLILEIIEGLIGIGFGSFMGLKGRRLMRLVKKDPIYRRLKVMPFLTIF